MAVIGRSMPRIVRRPSRATVPSSAELEAARLERDLGVVAGVEEVLALDDVGAELRAGA